MLGDLDDFITPSQQCINPIFTDGKPTVEKSKEEKGVAKISLDSSIFDGLPYDCIWFGWLVAHLTAAPSPTSSKLAVAERRQQCRSTTVSHAGTTFPLIVEKQSNRSISVVV